MIAYIGSGYGSIANYHPEGTVTHPPSEYASDTAVYYINYYSPDPTQPACYDPYLMDVMPWIFERPDPWRSLIHYPPAPRKMLPKRISGSYRKPLKLKQPVARSGFKRGQRR